MLELELTLGFACSACQQSVSARLKCSGEGLAAGSRAVAAVNVPCPYCGLVNCLSFQPDGTVREVTLGRGSRALPEPSMN